MHACIRLAIIILLAAPLRSVAQNLVVNPSFETITTCPLGPSELDKAVPWRDPFQNLLGDTCSTSDVYNSCNPFGGLSVGVPNNILGSQDARTGEGYAGIIVYEGFVLLGCQPLFGSGWREYLHGSLTQPMAAGETYCVEFHVSLADNVKFASPNIGVYLSATPVNVSCATINGSSVLPFTPQLEYGGPEVTNTGEWVRLQWNYTATGGERYIVIGNFRDDATTAYTCVNEAAFNPYAYYYIDDVSVEPGACCNAEFAAVPPLCVGDAPVLLQPTVPGGTWSGPGITAPNSGAFDPTLAGPGLHTVVHTLPCGSDSLQIAVTTCTGLEVCVDDDGTWNVSNGLGPYTWQVQDSIQDCSACFFGCIIPPGCAVNVAAWVPFATGTSIPPPAALPVRVVDTLGNVLEIASAADLPPCVNCPAINVALEQLTDVACFGGSDGAASVLASGGAAPYTYAWVPGGLQGAQQGGLAAGNYLVMVMDADSCPGSLQVVIDQPAEPVVAQIGGDPLVGDAPLAVVFTNTSSPPGAAFQWNFGDGGTFTGAEAAHTFTQPGIYTVVMAATVDACSDSDTLLVVVNGPIGPDGILVPNVFSPNGDGQNDTWGAEGFGLVRLSAQVFNRWGGLVAELGAPGQTWNGRTPANDPVPEGTYYYILEATGPDGIAYRFTGALTLLR